MTQTKLPPKPRSAAMVGKAVETIEPSSALIRAETTSPEKLIQTFRSSWDVAVLALFLEKIRGS